MSPPWYGAQGLRRAHLLGCCSSSPEAATRGQIRQQLRGTMCHGGFPFQVDNLDSMKLNHKCFDIWKSAWISHPFIIQPSYPCIQAPVGDIKDIQRLIYVSA